MKRVVIGLTVWNVVCPAVALGTLLLSFLSGWDSETSAAVAPFFLLAFKLWAFGTPVIALGAYLWCRRHKELLLKHLNLGAALVWVIGAPTVASILYL